MSWTEMGEPQNVQFIDAEPGICIMFECPRCETTQTIIVRSKDLLCGVDFECTNSRCRRSEKQAGYYGSLRLEWNSSMLGLLDKPLEPEG